MKTRRKTESIPEYYGKGGRLGGGAGDELVNSAYQHDCADADVLLEGLNYADLAHAIMLVEQKIIPRKAGSLLIKNLLEIQKIKLEDFPIRPELGDVYNSKDALLKKRIGDTAGWLHAGRARREAVNIGYLLAVRARLLRLVGEHISLGEILVEQAEKNVATVMPDFTYLQHAHPTSLGHYILTYVYPMLRDLERLRNSYIHFDQCPAGSGSVNGSRLPLHRHRLMTLLGFGGVISHTRDAMWQPDIPIELMANIVTLLVNINRFAEELQIWSTAEFDMVDFSDELSRASVIMPQKKNPYGLAYIRGLTGSMLGKVSSFAALGKTYSGNPDSRTFIYGELPRSLEKTAGGLRLLKAIIVSMKPNKEVMRRRVMEGFSQATDLADLIMTKKGVDYRAAHQIVGLTVRKSLAAGIAGSQVTSQMLDDSAKEILGKPLRLDEKTIQSALDPRQVIESRQGVGGASAKRVLAMVKECRKTFGKFSFWLQESETHQEKSLQQLLKTAATYSKGTK